MPYLNLDDNYPDHPKVEALSDAAYRFHGALMFYVAKHRLDGYLTEAQLHRRRNWSRRTERELTCSGLLHDPMTPCESTNCPLMDSTHYRLHDYFQWNKSRAWWDEEREKAAKRKAKWKADHAASEQESEHE
jgi:hypothetical protein